MNTNDFVRAANGSVPAGALVISTEEDCANCTLIAKSINYTVYAVTPNDVTMNVAALRPEAFRAQIAAEGMPTTLKAASNAEVNVQVKNLSDATWPAVGESSGRHAVTLHARWLKTDGTLVSEGDSSSRFPYDLEPGDTGGVTLKITAPQFRGQYLLELDVVQEQVAWFGSKGSQTLRAEVEVEE
jgi:hypothetical protein